MSTGNYSVSEYCQPVPGDAPTTTSYALLSLLAVKPWSTYELAQQMTRSLGVIWPRAVSVLYEEPKKLVRLGFATSSGEPTGNRRRTVYSITATGRRALASWLAQPGADPVMEHEALVKVAFADHGNLEGLRQVVASIRTGAEQRRDQIRQEMAALSATGGPFPDRLPVIGLAGKLVAEQAELLARWAEWAEGEISRWEGVTPDTGARTPPRAFEPGWPKDSS